MSDWNLQNTTLLHSGLRGGSNQARVRDHNERLVLSLVRRNGSLSKAQIARMSGLSAQTATVIMRALEKEKLLLRDAPVRGKVGQPSIPMRLNPDGVYSIGLKVGRRSADLVLMDFVGTIKQRLHVAYSFPDTVEIVDFVAAGVEKLTQSLPKNLRHTIAGVGIAIPFELWHWGKHVGASERRMSAWKGFDLKGAVSKETGLPSYLENDASAACGAELVLGNGREFDSFVYLYVGFFIGGGIVLNNHVVSGPTGNAGSFGAMPVDKKNKKNIPLMDVASIFVLANMLAERDINPKFLWESPENWEDIGETLELWIEQIAQALATAIVSTCSVVDFSAVLIDGGCPKDVRHRIVSATKDCLSKMDTTGIQSPQVLEGSIGPSAPATGGAILPIVSRYLINPTAIYN